VTGLTVQDRVDLRDFLVRRFTLPEIEDLLFEIGLSSDDLPSDTRPELARAVIGHCERTDTLGCLLERVMIARPDDGIAAMMAKVGPCDAGRVKVQVIFPVDQLRVSREEFTRTVAALFHNASPDSIELIGAAQGGARALVSLPAHQAGAPPAAAADVRAFDALESLDQQTWRYGLERAYWQPSAQLPAAGAPPVAAATKVRAPQPAPARKPARGPLIGAAVVAAIGVIVLVAVLVPQPTSAPSSGDGRADGWRNTLGLVLLLVGIGAAFAFSRLSPGMSGAPAPAADEQARPPTWDNVRAAVAQGRMQ
jgi:hypothetical protein